MQAWLVKVIYGTQEDAEAELQALPGVTVIGRRAKATDCILYVVADNYSPEMQEWLDLSDNDRQALQAVSIGSGYIDPDSADSLEDLELIEIRGVHDYRLTLQGQKVVTSFLEESENAY
jgi:hypothetical protein